MIRSRNARSLPVFVTSAAFGLLIAMQAGCGTSRPAEAPSCPTGTVLHGKDCLPDDDAESSPKSTDSAEEKPAKSASSDNDSSEESTPAPAPKKKPKPALKEESDAPSNTAGSPSSPSYDKDSILPILKRASTQVKNNCGAATNEDGESGPWGKTKATVTLGRNGHTRSTTVAPEFDGKPAGQCIIQAFKKLVFPPYDASSDESIELDLDVKKPAGK